MERTPTGHVGGEISPLREPAAGRWTRDVGTALCPIRDSPPLRLSPTSLNAGDLGAYPRGYGDAWMNVQG